MDRHENCTADRSCRDERPKIFRNLDICFRFRVICAKLLFDPHVLFEATAAMFFDGSKNTNGHFVQDVQRNNLAKFH